MNGWPHSYSHTSRLIKDALTITNTIRREAVNSNHIYKQNKMDQFNIYKWFKNSYLHESIGFDELNFDTHAIDKFGERSMNVMKDSVAS